MDRHIMLYIIERFRHCTLSCVPAYIKLEKIKIYGDTFTFQVGEMYLYKEMICSQVVTVTEQIRKDNQRVGESPAKDTNLHNQSCLLPTQHTHTRTYSSFHNDVHISIWIFREGRWWWWCRLVVQALFSLKEIRIFFLHIFVPFFKHRI